MSANPINEPLVSPAAQAAPTRSAAAASRDPAGKNLWGVGDVVDVKVQGKFHEASGKITAVQHDPVRYSVMLRENKGQSDGLTMQLKDKEEDEVRAPTRPFIEYESTSCLCRCGCFSFGC